MHACYLSNYFSVINKYNHNGKSDPLLSHVHLFAVGLNAAALLRSRTLTHHHRLWKWVALSTPLKLTHPHLHLKSITVLFSNLSLKPCTISVCMFISPRARNRRTKEKERRLIPLLCLFHVLLPGFFESTINTGPPIRLIFFHRPKKIFIKARRLYWMFDLCYSD